MTNQIILINKNNAAQILSFSETEALQLSDIQIMAFVYSFVKALNDLECHPVQF